MEQSENPWKNISWKRTVAECDEGILSPDYCADKGIDISYLPEPYSGHPDSPVMCLNLNPGIGLRDACFQLNQTLLELTQKTLMHEERDNMWMHNITCEFRHVLHDGCIWWQNRIKALREATNMPTLDMFVLEYFPYHTKRAFAFPKLPSDKYRNWLLDKAMDEGKLIVVMRGLSRWESIKEKSSAGMSLSQRLSQYKNKIVMKNPRNVCFSPKNFSNEDWNKLITTLK